MDLLYGVIHNVRDRFPIFSDGEPMLKPSYEFLEELSNLPKGTKVGLEKIDPTESNAIMEHLRVLGGDREMSFEDGWFFWTPVLEVLEKGDHELVYLEDVNIWKKYNEAVLEVAKAKEIELIHYDDESNEAYHKKLIRRNEAVWKAGIKLRKIHEIDRDASLLERVKDVDVAIVGLGHSDYWISKELLDCQYHADCSSKKETFDYRNIFEKDRIPEESLVFERNSLERMLSFLESGNIMDEKPDYVGTWDRVNPSKGYFEVFIDEEENENFTGRIEDFLGTAVCIGTREDGYITFSKMYGTAVEGAVSDEIVYKAQGEEEFYGHFFINGFGSPFYMAKREKMDPEEMGMRLYELFQE